MVVLSKWRSALRVRGGTAGQTPASKVKLNRAKQASRMMPFINGNIGANWRAELRGGPSGCERESQTESEGRKERRDEVEGNSARGGLLPDLYNSFIIEAVQSESKAKACVKKKKKKEHTEATAYIRTQARQTGCVVNLQPSGYDEVRIFFILPLLLWFPPSAQCEAGVCGESLLEIVEARHTT